MMYFLLICYWNRALCLMDFLGCSMRDAKSLKSILFANKSLWCFLLSYHSFLLLFWVHFRNGIQSHSMNHGITPTDRGILLHHTIKCINLLLFVFDPIPGYEGKQYKIKYIWGLNMSISYVVRKRKTIS